MKKNQALSYIRQLCCLGLDKELLIAELLSTVKIVIPSSGNIYVGFDDTGIPSSVIPEYFVPDALEIYLEKSVQLYDTAAHAKLLSWFNAERVLPDPRIIDARFYETDLYHLVWRPYGNYHSLQAMVKCAGMPVGALLLFRSRTSSLFNDSERYLLERLLPYVEHGLLARNPPETAYADDGKTGMFIMDCNGRLIFASEAARNLLSLIRNPSYRVGQANLAREIEPPSALRQLCRNLDQIFQGREADPPALTHVTPRGRFVFRAHWLDSLNCEPGALIGVTLEHQEPVALRFLRGIKALPLSPAQMEVCLLLAQNHSQDSIAQRLHIKSTTVKDHIRKIYLKLDIHQRDELVGRLAAKTETRR